MRDVCVKPQPASCACFQYSVREAKLLYTMSLRIDAALNRALPVIEEMESNEDKLESNVKHVPSQPLTVRVSRCKQAGRGRASRWRLYCVVSDCVQ